MERLLKVNQPVSAGSQVSPPSWPHGDDAEHFGKLEGDIINFTWRVSRKTP